MNEIIKEKIMEYSKKIGIDKIGFTTAKPFDGLRRILTNHRKEGYESGFEEQDINKRVDPRLTLKDAKSMIAIAIAYQSKLNNAPTSEKGHYRGFVARSAWGLDYHLILQEKLDQLGSYIKELNPKAEYVYMTDTGVLSDHAVAERAGIGWIGKNSLLITPEFGSYVYLGEMIINIDLPEDKPMEEQCGECTICLDACPTQAIIQPGQVHAKKCLSYITQRKDVLEENLMEKLGNRLYGCDICQTVCPKNKGVNATHQKQTTPDPELAKPLLKPILQLSNREFRKTWGMTAAGWRGKKTIQRNVIIALANFKDQSALLDLKRILLEDNRPMIRQTTAWAIGKIGGNNAKEILQIAKIGEKDKNVMDEIEKSLNKLCFHDILD